jgi:purine-nucleoside phosphorylase
MSNLFNTDEIISQIKKITNFSPEIAIILGSGWGKIVDEVENPIVIDYSSLKGFPTCTVKGHNGKFIFGEIASKKVIIMQGRFHLYEGKSPSEVVSIVDIANKLGATKLILTNASGAVNLNYNVGDIMIIKDHINLTMQNPLTGIIATDENPIFIDLHKAYSDRLNKIVENICKNKDYTYHYGVYTQLLGPSYETKAEINFLRVIGTDAVGMSTVQETIYANYLKMEVCGIVCITNKTTNLESPISHKEVLDVTLRNEDKLKIIIYELVKNM